MYLINSTKTTLPARVLRNRSAEHRRRTAGQKAAIGAGILNGEVAIKLSKMQIAKLVGVSVPYLNRACQLTQAEREVVADGGFDFDMPSDAELTRMIQRAGIDRTLSIACVVEQNTAA